MLLVVSTFASYELSIIVVLSLLKIFYIYCGDRFGFSRYLVR